MSYPGHMVNGFWIVYSFSAVKINVIGNSCSHIRSDNLPPPAPKETWSRAVRCSQGGVPACETLVSIAGTGEKRNNTWTNTPLSYLCFFFQIAVMLLEDKKKKKKGNNYFKHSTTVLQKDICCVFPHSRLVSFIWLFNIYERFQDSLVWLKCVGEKWSSFLHFNLVFKLYLNFHFQGSLILLFVVRKTFSFPTL